MDINCKYYNLDDELIVGGTQIPSFPEKFPEKFSCGDFSTTYSTHDPPLIAATGFGAIHDDKMESEMPVAIPIISIEMVIVQFRLI